MIHLIIHITGCDDVSGRWYAFWSGFGADLGEFAFVLVVWNRFRCHANGCKRIGIHHVIGTHYMTCRKHHPVHRGSRPASADDIQEAYEKSKTITTETPPINGSQ